MSPNVPQKGSTPKVETPASKEAQPKQPTTTTAPTASAVEQIENLLEGLGKEGQELLARKLQEVNPVVKTGNELARLAKTVGFKLMSDVDTIGNRIAQALGRFTGEQMASFPRQILSSLTWLAVKCPEQIKALFVGSNSYSDLKEEDVEFLKVLKSLDIPEGPEADKAICFLFRPR